MLIMHIAMFKASRI